MPVSGKWRKFRSKFNWTWWKKMILHIALENRAGKFVRRMTIWKFPLCVYTSIHIRSSLWNAAWCFPSSIFHCHFPILKFLQKSSCSLQSATRRIIFCNNERKCLKKSIISAPRWKIRVCMGVYMFAYGNINKRGTKENVEMFWKIVRFFQETSRWIVVQ